jgi:prephenate dehydrogenase
MNVCIVGIGLIGGSLAIDLRNRGFAKHITGVDSNPHHATIAKHSKLVDDIDNLENAVEKSDLIILSTPIDAIKKMLPAILDMVTGTDKVITDMGSTKAGMSKLVENHPNRKHYVASHPMAGTEYSGPLAAISKLFDYKCAIICDKEKSSPQALKVIKKMLNVLNMKVIYMNPQEHDVSAAYVSHISHISSFALSLCVLEKEKDQKRILSLASGGFASTVRLAKSSAEMWTPVFDQNSTYVLEVLDTYIEKLKLFRKHIENKNHKEITNLIIEANKIQKVLN